MTGPSLDLTYSFVTRHTNQQNRVMNYKLKRFNDLKRDMNVLKIR